MSAHYHCPYECEKPQPFQVHDGGKWYCGKHWHDDKELVECFECTPETCPGDIRAGEEGSDWMK